MDGGGCIKVAWVYEIYLEFILFENIDVIKYTFYQPVAVSYFALLFFFFFAFLLSLLPLLVSFLFSFPPPLLPSLKNAVFLGEHAEHFLLKKNQACSTHFFHGTRSRF